MGHHGVIEIFVVFLSMLIWMVGFAGLILGIVAFFKVRRLEKKVAELRALLLESRKIMH